MEFFYDFFILIGRVCISLVFLVSAFESLKHWSATQARMTEKGVPRVSLVLPIAIALQILGGLMVFFGWQAHIGALFLLIVAIPSLFFIHPFWKAKSEEAKVEKWFFLKTIGIIGGLFYILAQGSGQWGF